MGLFGPAAKKKRGDIVWGTVTIPFDLASYHFMATGSTGSGKSTLLRVLMRGVLPDVLVKDEGGDPGFDTRALIFDAKSEIIPDLADLKLRDETLILNPFDARCTAWDVGKDIQDEGQAQELAAVMVPPGEGANKYFYDASRLMLKTAALALMKAKPNEWTLRDLLLLCGNVGELKIIAEKMQLANLDAVEDFLEPTKEAKSVRMTLAVENNAFNVIAAAWHRAKTAGRVFSIQDWVAGKGPQILLLGSSKQSRTALATINRLLVQRVQQLTLDYQVRSAKTGRRTWIFLDEFPALGAIPHLEELLTEGRSRGICTVLGFQHIAHVNRWYGVMADALLGQCLHQAYFRANDAAVAEWCSRHFGLLISKEEDPDKPAHTTQTSNAATVNDFLFLEPATEKTGYQCILRSSKAVLPSGPALKKVRPQSDLVAVTTQSTDPRNARFIPWLDKLELEPWSVKERLELGLPEVATSSTGTPLPANDNPVLSSLPASSFWNS